jgi:hypothetical protein
MMEQMRGCDTAIVQIDANVLPREAEPRIPADVLIEIGAAMALYGRNFVLLVEDSVALPLSLQGLYECRYGGDELNMPAMMELLRAFSGFTRPSGHARGLRRIRDQPAPRAAAGRHRQSEGCWGLQGAAAIDRGVAGARLKGQGMRPSDSAKALKIGRASVYRLLAS